MVTPFGVEFPALRNVNVTAPAPEKAVPEGSAEETISGTVAQVSIALATLRAVFTPLFFRGVFTFLSWWVCVAMFTTTSFGMVYYQYFAV